MKYMSKFQRKTILVLSILAITVSLVWFASEPGYESTFALLCSAVTFCSFFWFKISHRYSQKSQKGKATFNYSDNNGKYDIGLDKLHFELFFSKASDTSIHIYNDPPSISGVALVTDTRDISKISDATIYDMSSRARTVQEGEIVILRNIHNNYAAVTIVDVKDRNRSDDVDEVTFEYVINPNGLTSFC